MDDREKIEQLRQQSFAFDVNVTLDEIEWTRILGPDGLGRKLLHQMAEIGAGFFRFDQLEHVRNGRAETFGFAVDEVHSQVRLAYEQPLTASLLTAAHRLLDRVNCALRRGQIAYRYILARDAATGAGCTYRLMLVPTTWLREACEVLNVVAGTSLEDYELQTPYPPPESGGDFWEITR